ncbi:DUF563 domain-containing protein [Telluribacter sp. SYSU D00476]|uniref:glycosyltransferase family 61 protein n=1 Tax=Telluribacter sp. SYSU D00476 TaxID=2811430 RepID=UPI001FF5B738|nr:glycosyltransferase family 61 protein [Telluribacter sp. SYSU D00476]
MAIPVPNKLYHILFSLCLRILKLIARQVQLGNPSLKAPSIVSVPEEQLNISSRIEGPKVWSFREALCSGLYGGAIINEKDQVYEQFLHFPWGRELHPSVTSPYLGLVKHTINKGVFLITPNAKGNYFHWITDLLPRLIKIKQEVKDMNDRILILHHPATSYEISSLSALGFDANKVIRLHPFELARVKDLVVAEYIDCGRSFPIWKKNLLDQLYQLPLYKEDTGERSKIYLKRGREAKRQLIGEEILCGELQRLGFKIINPRYISFTEQASLLSKASVVVALHGAALTNIIFCKPDTTIIEIRSELSPPEHYSAIAKAYNLRFQTISAPPQKSSQVRHLANKQHLVLTEQALSRILNLVREIVQ